MATEKNKAVMQMPSYRITSLSVRNDFFGLPQRLAGSIQTKTNIDSIASQSSGLVAAVRFSTSIENWEDFGDGDAPSPVTNDQEKLSVEVIISATFSFSSDDEALFRRMISINGAATLYSITRGIISSTTALSLCGGAVNVPLLNFAAAYKEEASQSSSESK